jgi:hypothetical protein
MKNNTQLYKDGSQLRITAMHALLCIEDLGRMTHWIKDLGRKTLCTPGTAKVLVSAGGLLGGTVKVETFTVEVLIGTKKEVCIQTILWWMCKPFQLSCSVALAAQTTLRHDILKGTLRRGGHRISPRATPPSPPRPCRQRGHRGRWLPPPPGGDIRGDILMALPHHLRHLRIHPLSIHVLPCAATTAGVAASPRDQQKRAAYARVEPKGYGFVPLSVETYYYVL